MMHDHRTLVTRELDADSLPKAYPILQALGGSAAVAEWLRFACDGNGHGDGDGAPHGILAVEDHKGYVLGLFRYQVVEHPMRGRSLECENFTVPDLIRSGLPFESLIESAERIARLYDCRHLSVSIATTEPRGVLPPAMRDHLDRLSFAFDSIRFSKTLAPRDASGDVGPLDAP
jgi:hypothetical protein